MTTKPRAPQKRPKCSICGRTSNDLASITYRGATLLFCLPHLNTPTMIALRLTATIITKPNP